jgi:hypothetical protein
MIQFGAAGLILQFSIRFEMLHLASMASNEVLEHLCCCCLYERNQKSNMIDCHNCLNQLNHDICKHIESNTIQYMNNKLIYRLISNMVIQIYDVEIV